MPANDPLREDLPDEDPPSFIFLALALSTGVGIDILAWGHALGLGSAVAGIGVVALLASKTPNVEGPVAGATAVFFASLAWRASPEVQALNLSFGVAGVGLMIYRSRISAWMVRDALRGIISPWAEALPRGLDYLKRSIPTLIPDSLRSAFPWLRGSLVAVPFLIVFGALFSSADSTFARLAERLLDIEIDINTILRHLTVTMLATVAIIGLWRYPLRTPLTGPFVSSVRIPQESTVVLGALNMLFGSFVVVQFSHFFGESATTLAEAARRGFFELVVVSGLVIIIILTVDTITDPSRVLKLWSMGLVSQTLIIWVSAMGRMANYVNAFGLTQLRLYTTVFMVWIGFLLGIASHTILRSKRPAFVKRGIVAACVLMMTITILNPDGLITRVNLSANDKPDLSYISELSIDRGPALKLFDTEICPAAKVSLMRDIAEIADADIRSWAWSSYRAKALLTSWPSC